MADVEIVDLNPKLSPDGTELLEIQEVAGGVGTSFHTPLSNLIGPQGPQGDPGADGADGQNATADAGTTTTTAPGSNAAVTNVGTTQDAVFDFDIPRGDVGAQGIQGVPGNDGADGADGAAATADAGTTTTTAPGTNAAVTNVGTTSAAVFDFDIPRGDKGDQGDPGTGYNLIGSETVANLNALTAAAIGTSDAYIMLDGSPPDVQPIGATQAVTVAVDDLIVWSEGDYFVNYGQQSGGAGGDVVGPASSVDDNLTTFSGTTGKLIKDSGVGIAKVNTALQPGSNNSELVNDSGYTTNTGDVVGPASAVNNRLAAFDGTTGELIKDSGSLASDFATFAQGALADTAMQPGDDISDLNNNAGYGQGDVTGPGTSVNNRIATFFGTNGKVIQDGGSLISDFATAAQGATADTATQPGDNVSTLTNDAGYTTVSDLNDLGDVTLTAPADKEGLTYNGAAWVNGFPYESGSVLPSPAGYPEGFLFCVTT